MPTRSATEIGVVIFYNHWRSPCRVRMVVIKKTGGGSDTGAWGGGPKATDIGSPARNRVKQDAHASVSLRQPGPRHGLRFV